MGRRESPEPPIRPARRQSLTSTNERRPAIGFSNAPSLSACHSPESCCRRAREGGLSGLNLLGSALKMVLTTLAAAQACRFCVANETSKRDDENFYAEPNQRILDQQMQRSSQRGIWAVESVVRLRVMRPQSQHRRGTTGALSQDPGIASVDEPQFTEAKKCLAGRPYGRWEPGLVSYPQAGRLSGPGSRRTQTTLRPRTLHHSNNSESLPTP